VAALPPEHRPDPALPGVLEFLHLLTTMSS